MINKQPKKGAACKVRKNNRPSVSIITISDAHRRLGPSGMIQVIELAPVTESQNTYQKSITV